MTKLYAILFTRGFKYANLIDENTTIINNCPGYIKTNLVPGGMHMAQGIETANHTYQLATDDKYANPGGLPKYYS